MGILVKEIGGFCPVQAEGTIDGEKFYFRARGQHWSLSIGGKSVIGDPDWTHREPWGDDAYAAGWMDLTIARQMIEKGAALWRESKNVKHRKVRKT